MEGKCCEGKDKPSLMSVISDLEGNTRYAISLLSSTNRIIYKFNSPRLSTSDGNCDICEIDSKASNNNSVIDLIEKCNSILVNTLGEIEKNILDLERKLFN
jgi:hypothetical protein